jgi:hypothetical protein
MPLGVNREKAARAAEKAAMNALPTIEMLPASARRGAHDLAAGIPVGHAPDGGAR